VSSNHSIDRSPYLGDIGRPCTTLPTPALLLDRRVAHHNIALMAERTGAHIGLRPHFKSHKCLELARLQIEAGAVGMTAATVWEAAALVRAGIGEVLIANEVAGAAKIRLVAELARHAPLLIAVDNERNAEDLSAAAGATSSTIGVLIDIDVGQHRCGVRTAAEAVKLATHVSRLPGLQLRGVMGYEGHCVLERNRDERSEQAGTAMTALLVVVDALERKGLAIEIVSAGGTGTYDLTGEHKGITELQAGSYVLMDAERLQIAPAFAVAVTVLASVVSRQGQTLVLDCGRKTVGMLREMPQIPSLDATIRSFAEEHLVLDLTGPCSLEVGDQVQAISGYVPLTANLHQVYHVVEDGVVVDIWPIVARGSARLA